MDDASLDEFVGSERDGDGSDANAEPAEPTDPEPADANATEGEETEVGEEASEEDAATDPTPATVTYQWAPNSECAACGESVPRRWQDDGAMVCEDCKAW